MSQVQLALVLTQRTCHVGVCFFRAHFFSRSYHAHCCIRTPILTAMVHRVPDFSGSITWFAFLLVYNFLRRPLIRLLADSTPAQKCSIIS